MDARDVLASEEAEGRPLEVLASEDEIGRRAEDEASRWTSSQVRRRRLGRRRSLPDGTRWAEDKIQRSSRRGGGGPTARGPRRPGRDRPARGGQGSVAGRPFRREEADGWPPEILAGEDEISRREEAEGRPQDVLAGEEAKGRPSEVLARQDEVGRRTSLPASDWAGRRMGRKGRAADACSRRGGDDRGAWWRRLQRRRVGGRGASKWN